MDNILVTIAARGGSKGIKDKNLRPLMDKPLIGHSIEQAKAWGKAGRIIISTDSEMIADVARKAGAEVPFMRLPELAEDTTPKGLVIKDALLRCEELYQEQFSIIVDLDATAPLRTTDDLDKCLELYKEKRPKTLFSVTRAHKNPYFNMVERNAEGEIVLSKRAEVGVNRRQDTPEVYAMNASIYFYDRQYLLEEEAPSAVSDRSEIYLMDDITGFDIDREVDLKFVEFLMSEYGAIS